MALLPALTALTGVFIIPILEQSQLLKQGSSLADRGLVQLQLLAEQPMM